MEVDSNEQQQGEQRTVPSNTASGERPDQSQKFKNMAIPITRTGIPSAKSLASGALFGAAITAAGVYSPAVITGQMNFTDFHMLKVFIAASASSA
jgi:hypothetical protein